MGRQYLTRLKPAGTKRTLCGSQPFHTGSGCGTVWDAYPPASELYPQEGRSSQVQNDGVSAKAEDGCKGEDKQNHRTAVYKPDEAEIWDA